MSNGQSFSYIIVRTSCINWKDDDDDDGSPCLDKSLQSDTLFWFRANQSLTRMCCVHSEEIANINFTIFGLIQPVSALRSLPIQQLTWIEM